MKTFICAILLFLAIAATVHAAIFAEVIETYADGSERSYVIRFLPDGRECIWNAPVVSNCPSPTNCMAKNAPKPTLPNCISLCSGGLQNMVCPWE